VACPRLGHTDLVRFTKGQVLVATPPLVDPHFDRTVVFMVEHNDQGAFGLVLNRPSETQLVGVIPEWSSAANWPAVMFIGGPVQTDAVIALGLRRQQRSDGVGWVHITDSLGTVDLSRDPTDVGAVDGLRVFVGYSGWGPGQLDSELAANAWIVADADLADPFTAAPHELWRHVLGRQRGSIGWMRHFPDDVAVN
jgi:putative transcriptional regulator